MSHLVVPFKFIPFFLATVSPNWGDIKHPISEFYKCAPEEALQYESLLDFELNNDEELVTRLTFLLGYPSQQCSEE